MIDKLLDKISTKGKDSLTNLEKEYLSNPDDSKFKDTYFSMEQFEEDGEYITKDGRSIRINRITDEIGYKDQPYRKVSFILNYSINDMQDWDNFLSMMNGGGHTII